MSVEEQDTELRDLLIQTLENNGSLAKIRAQVRACTFLACDEDEKIQAKKPLVNKDIQAQLESNEGHLMFQLVHEFLEYFNMRYTISVYEAESYLGTNYLYEGRHKLLKDFNMSESDSAPILLRLIQSLQTKSIHLSNGHKENTNPDVMEMSLPECYENNVNEEVITPKSQNSDLKDDTYEDASLIAEDSIKEQLQKEENTKDTSISTSIHSNSSPVPQVLVKNDKTKQTPRSTSSKSPISDSPLPKTKIIDAELLPSLYRDANHTQDSNDMDNYEEDFNLSESVDYQGNHSKNKEEIKSITNKLDILHITTKNLENEDDHSTIPSTELDGNSIEEIMRST